MSDNPAKLILLLCAALWMGAAGAETLYVSDQLRTALRSGPSDGDGIIIMLTSGTELDVLEKHGPNGYSRARTDKGVEGWINTGYLMDQPAARDRLTAMETRATTLEAENAAILAKAQDQAQLVENATALDNENKALKGRLQGLEQEHEQLAQAHAQLSAKTEQHWFLIGAGVLFGGMLIGLIVPKIRWRKRSSWDSL